MSESKNEAKNESEDGQDTEKQEVFERLPAWCRVVLTIKREHEFSNDPITNPKK